MAQGAPNPQRAGGEIGESGFLATRNASPGTTQSRDIDRFREPSMDLGQASVLPWFSRGMPRAGLSGSFWFTNRLETFVPTDDRRIAGRRYSRQPFRGPRSRWRRSGDPPGGGAEWSRTGPRAHRRSLGGQRHQTKTGVMGHGEADAVPVNPVQTAVCKTTKPVA